MLDALRVSEGTPSGGHQRGPVIGKFASARVYGPGWSTEVLGSWHLPGLPGVEFLVRTQPY